MPKIATAPASSALKGETTIKGPGGAGASVARRAAETRATVPDLELGIDVDARAALTLARAEGYSLTAILVGAAATALRALPWANAAYRDGRFELYDRVNIGVVVTAEEALMIPAVLDADAKSLGELTEELALLAARARSGELTAPEQAGTTFTLSDFTALPAHRVTPLITPPQAAALTAGAVRRAPVIATDGSVVAGEVISLALACDHRILFGERAQRLLGQIAELLAEPRR